MEKSRIKISNAMSRQNSARTFLAALAIFIALFCGTPQNARAAFLNLDSIASWGKFPRFCVNTYRWGDRFFNGYDSTYVQGSGHRLNIKAKADSWMDVYDFRFKDHYKLSFENHPSTSMGLWLTYMAVSVGYDVNVSKIFNPSQGARKRFDFQFNCMLFAAEYYSIDNTVGMTISRMGYPDRMKRVRIDFDGFHSNSWGLNLYYFFNHKHYSQAAAFHYSKIQVKSAGSLYAGFAYWQQKYDMDFTGVMAALGMPPSLSEWDNHYRVSNKNYAIKIGYAYNWVFHKGWCVGISEAPTIGIRDGYINMPQEQKTSFSLSNRFRASLIYNRNKRWFFGIVGNVDTGLIYDKQHTLLSNNFSLEASAGFRFDIW